jgi:hypothetical protein
MRNRMTSVSELEFWKTGQTAADRLGPKEGEGGTYLSYNVFVVLSILGGFFALDHLYLRSPLTFLAKLLVNFFFFGVWWIYDMAQALFNRDVVKIYGLGVPGFGPKGIAAGVLASDVPDKKHYTFILYGLAVLAGGAIGLDSFLLGDRRTGFIRLFSMLSVVLAPLALGWWAYNSFRFLVDTEDVVREHADFFGAPAGGSIADKWAARFPILGALFSPVEWLQRMLAGVLGPAMAPVQAAAEAVKGVSATVDGVVDVASKALDKGAEITGNLKGVVDDVAMAAAHIQDASPVTSMYAAATAAGLKDAASAVDAEAKTNKEPGQTGGAMAAAALTALSLEDVTPLHALLISTIVFIVAAGLYTTYHRAQNVARRDDAPPEPGVLRVPDRERRTA